MAPITYLGELRAFAFNYCPAGWAAADGSQVRIIDNQPLMALLGITYGGNGATTFALPDLRSRAPMGAGPNNPQGTVQSAPSNGPPQRFLTVTWCIAVQGTYPTRASARRR